MTKRNKNVKQRTKKKQLKNGVEKEYKYWVVDIGRIGIDGKGRFKSFKKKTEADKYARRKDIEKEQYGKEALKFSDNNRSDALNAMKALNGHTTLEESAKFYIKHHVSIAKKMTVTSLWDEFILSKKNAKSSNLAFSFWFSKYLMELRHNLNLNFAGNHALVKFPGN